MIERLRLRNFRRYRDATMSFDPGLNFIQGLNNAGKTSLFFAIEYAFFGRVENFKTIRSLLRPGKRSLGVEIVFRGKDGEKYLLQRVHEQPAKKKTLEGHFTLKSVQDDSERYLLASDFGDTEDKLALKLVELTGLTRRLFSIALHMRQGEIPAILEGAKQLDIVLGATAASMAEEELRLMALELEKESARLPVLVERLRSVEAELTQLGTSLAGLADERKTAQEKLAKLGETHDVRAQFEERIQPLVRALTEHQAKSDELKLQHRRLEDEEKRSAAVLQSGGKDAIAAEVAKLTTETTARAKVVKKIAAEMQETEAAWRTLAQQRGDLAGRIERRKGLPTGKGAKCEYCGSPIKAAQTAKELEEWIEELKRFDKQLTEQQTKQAKSKADYDKEALEDRKAQERAGLLQRQNEMIAQAEALLVQRRKEFDAANASASSAFDAVVQHGKAAALAVPSDVAAVAWSFEGEPAAVAASLRQQLQSVRQALAERMGRQMAERQAIADLLTRFESQVQSTEKRQADLQRDQASVHAEASALQLKAARAERFRKLSAAFKELQVRLRTEAATKLAPDAMAVHRMLASSDEFDSLTIDPSSYAVQVVPKHLGQEVPAGLYEGGGHRLLLGLSYRLAIARLVGRCPFLMLDEPTYGLDDHHRNSLMSKLAAEAVAPQVLVVTHHAKEDVAGRRIEVVRQDQETVVSGA